MFDSFEFFPNIISKYFSIQICLTSYNIKEWVRSLFFDVIVVVRDFIEGFWAGDVVGYNAGVRAFIIVGDNGPVGLLATGVVVVVPGVGAFGDVEVDWKCGHTSVIVEILLVLSEKGRFSGATETEYYDFVLGDVLGLLAVKWAVVHH